MLKERLDAARMVGTSLSALEEALDDALVCAAQLTAAMPTARRRANVSPVVGQDALALIGEAMAALHAARAKVVEGHSALAIVRDEIGLREHASGDLWKLLEEKKASLRVVEAA